MLKKNNLFIAFVVISLLLSCQKEDQLSVDNVNVLKNNEKSNKKNLKPTVEDALLFVSKNFTYEKSVKTKSSKGINDYEFRIDTIYVIPKSNKPFLKLVCFAPKGYALVSDIDNVPNPPVLFYDSEKLDLNNVNPGLIEYIEEFADTYSDLASAPLPGRDDKDGDGAWDDGRDSDTGDPRDSPYYHKETVVKRWTEQSFTSPLLNTYWHQGKPYNSNCPVINGKSAPAGCVAIAVGQIMNYHRKNTFKKYSWDRINRSLLPDISIFIRNIGDGVGMDYGAEASSSNSAKAINYFKEAGYQASYYDYNYSSFKTFIDRKLPVYLSAKSSKRRYRLIGIKLPFAWKYEGGHAWVADAYKIVRTKEKVEIDRGKKGGISYVTRTPKTTSYIHMNWGWSLLLQENGGWCTYDYFKHGDIDYKYKKKMLVAIP